MTAQVACTVFKNLYFVADGQSGLGGSGTGCLATAGSLEAEGSSVFAISTGRRGTQTDQQEDYRGHCLHAPHCKMDRKTVEVP